MGGRTEREDTTQKAVPTEQERAKDKRDIVCPKCGRRNYAEYPLYYHRCPHCGYEYGYAYEVH